VLTVIQTRLLEGNHSEGAHRESLIVLTNELMAMIVLPYFGPAGHRRELGRPAPMSESVPRDGVSLPDPFKDAGLRLTYRTVLVLTAIAERPGASNRLIGDAAGISDQGQISKLLGRLQRAGLLSNTGLGPGQGAPNVWALTESGRRVASTIRSHTEDSIASSKGHITSRSARRAASGGAAQGQRRAK
jgi:DNA-binding MarR family transcriptional regulator